MRRPALSTIALALLVGGLLLQPALAAPQWGGSMHVQAPPRMNHGMQRAPVFAAPPRQPAAIPHREPVPPQPQQQPQQRPLPAPRAELPARPSLSPSEAAQRARQINGGGRVLAVDPADDGYRVRVLKNGEVRSVFVPGG